MRRDHRVAAILFGAGFAALLAAYLIHKERSAHFAERPEATGEIGIVRVYAQKPNGPVRLQPGLPRDLQRPQDISFQWNVAGGGPRTFRVEIHTERAKTVMHEETLSAPADQLPLDYVLALDDSAPDEFELVVIVESPHAAAYESRYPIHLRGSSKRELERD